MAQRPIYRTFDKNFNFILRRDHQKNFLWASRLWVGRRKKLILGYVPKNVEKKNLVHKGLISVQIDSKGKKLFCIANKVKLENIQMVAWFCFLIHLTLFALNHYHPCRFYFLQSYYCIAGEERTISVGNELCASNISRFVSLVVKLKQLPRCWGPSIFLTVVSLEHWIYSGQCMWCMSLHWRAFIRTVRKPQLTGSWIIQCSNGKLFHSWVD